MNEVRKSTKFWARKSAVDKEFSKEIKILKKKRSL
jgi:hypothetical protein